MKSEAKRIASHSDPDQPQETNAQSAKLIQVPEITTYSKIINEHDIQKAKRKRKKLKENLKMIQKLKDMKESKTTFVLNEEQIQKLQKENTWQMELETLEHNLQ